MAKNSWTIINVIIYNALSMFLEKISMKFVGFFSIFTLKLTSPSSDNSNYYWLDWIEGKAFPSRFI